MNAIKERSNAIVQNETIDKGIALDVVSIVHEAETLMMRELTQKDDKIKQLEYDIQILKNENKMKHIEDQLLIIPKITQNINDIQKITEYVQKIDLNTFMSKIDNQISQISTDIQELQNQFEILKSRIDTQDKDRKKKRSNSIGFI